MKPSKQDEQEQGESGLQTNTSREADASEQSWSEANLSEEKNEDNSEYDPAGEVNSTPISAESSGDENENYQPIDTGGNEGVQPATQEAVASPPPSPISSSTPAAEEAAKPNTPGSLILQWLTYAFWGWTILAMSALTYSVIYSFLSNDNYGSFTAYAIAAVLVLLPISAACDYFYTKLEPAKKQGPATIIMVIHAVLFALFGIASVITAVFALVTIATSSSDSTGSQVAFLSAVVVALLYAAVFLRTMAFIKLYWVKVHFLKFMIAVVGIIVALGFIGPFAQARMTRNDVLISSNIGSVDSAIKGYARENSKLPESLSDLELRGDAKKLVEQNLLKYTPNSRGPEPGLDNTSTSLRNSGTAGRTTLSNSTNLYFTLCATYTEENKSDYYSEYYSDYDLNGGVTAGYKTNHSYYYYDKGENCYKTQLSVNN